MISKFTAALAAFALAFTALAPGVASAREHRGGYYGGGYNRGGGYGYGGHGYYRYNDNGDAVAAGVIGLVLGLAVGAAASQPRAPRYSSNCYNGCYAPPPPPCGGCYNQGYYNQGYYNRGYAPPPPQPYYQQGYNQGYSQRDDGRDYDPRYDDSGLAGGGYDQRGGCTRAERQRDRYANRYVTVDVPC